MSPWKPLLSCRPCLFAGSRGGGGHRGDPPHAGRILQPHGHGECGCLGGRGSGPAQLQARPLLVFWGSHVGGDLSNQKEWASSEGRHTYNPSLPTVLPGAAILISSFPQLVLHSTEEQEWTTRWHSRAPMQECILTLFNSPQLCAVRPANMEAARKWRGACEAWEEPGARAIAGPGLGHEFLSGSSRSQFFFLPWLVGDQLP